MRILACVLSRQWAKKSEEEAWSKFMRRRLQPPLSQPAPTSFKSFYFMLLSSDGNWVVPTCLVLPAAVHGACPPRYTVNAGLGSTGSRGMRSLEVLPNPDPRLAQALSVQARGTLIFINTCVYHLQEEETNRDENTT